MYTRKPTPDKSENRYGDAPKDTRERRMKMNKYTKIRTWK